MGDIQSVDADESGDTSRRSVLLGLGAGAAGAVIGGAGSAAAQSEDNNGDDEDDVTTYVRGAHMARGVPSITGYVDDEVVEEFENVEYLDVTEYAPLPAGVHTFRATVPDMGDRTVYQAQGALGPGAYTVVGLGDLANGERPVPMLLQDDLGPENGLPEQAQGKARGRNDEAYARLVHAVADASPVTVTTGGGRTLFEDVQFAEATTYMRVPSGSRTIRVRPADDGDTVLAEFSLSLESGNFYTVFAAPDDPIQPVVVHDEIERND